MNNPNHLDLTGEMIATRISNEGQLPYADVMKIMRRLAKEAAAALLRGESVELDGVGTLRVSFVKRNVAEADPEAELVKNSRTNYRPFKIGEQRLIPTLVVDTDPQLAAVLKPMGDASAVSGTLRPYYSTKLTEAQCDEARRMVEAGELTATEVAKRFGIDRKTLFKIRRAVKQQPTTEAQEGMDDET